MRLEVNEAEIDFVTGQLSSVVQAENDIVLHQAGVDGGHAHFKLLIQLENKKQVCALELNMIARDEIFTSP